LKEEGRNWRSFAAGGGGEAKEVSQPLFVVVGEAVMLSFQSCKEVSHPFVEALLLLLLFVFLIDDGCG